MGEWDFVIGAVWGAFMTLNVIQMMRDTDRRQNRREGN